MTVSELIKELQAQDPEVEVLCDFEDNDNLTILGVEGFSEDDGGPAVMLNLAIS